MSDCLFCKIANGEIPAQIVFQDEGTVAFRDIDPQAPVHILVIPRRHLASLATAVEGDVMLLGRILRTVATVAQQAGIVETGFRTVFNTGSDAQQSVAHVHAHVIGGRHLTWPPG